MRAADLLADALSAREPGDPDAEELVTYARDAGELAPNGRERVERYLAASPSHRDRFRALAPPDWELPGSCLCGAVRYTARGPLRAVGHCHCQVCRKAHGAAFGTFGLTDATRFRWLDGESLLTRFEGPGGDARAFCGRCGTTLTGAAPAGLVALALATLDVDPVSRPALHAHVDDRAAWTDIRDDLPRLPGGWQLDAERAP